MARRRFDHIGFCDGSSYLFMLGQEFTAVGGMIMILSVPFSIFGFNGLFEKFKKKMPHYANWGWMLFLFGAAATINFGMRGVLSEIFGITITDLEVASVQHPVIFTAIFFAIGPMRRIRISSNQLSGYICQPTQEVKLYYRF
jgi:hypothetical protein